MTQQILEDPVCRLRHVCIGHDAELMEHVRIAGGGVTKREQFVAGDVQRVLVLQHGFDHIPQDRRLSVWRPLRPRRPPVFGDMQREVAESCGLQHIAAMIAEQTGRGSSYGVVAEGPEDIGKHVQTDVVESADEDSAVHEAAEIGHAHRLGTVRLHCLMDMGVEIFLGTTLGE